MVLRMQLMLLMTLEAVFSQEIFKKALYGIP